MSDLFRNVLVSSPNSGGLFLVRNGETVRLDAIDTTGIDQQDGIFLRGEQPNRVWIFGKTTAVLGGQSLNDVHDVLCVDESIYAVATAGNMVVRLDRDGRELMRWTFAGEPDSRHLNCLARWRGEVVFSSFGDFVTHRGYKGRTRGAGMVQSLVSGRALITGLSQPHSLVAVGGNLLLANSEEFELHEYDDQARLVRKMSLPGYTRGICVEGDTLYVGLSRSRNVEAGGLQSATILALDAGSWEELGRVAVPTSEIYSLMTFPDVGELLDVVSRVGGHAAVRLQEQVATLVVRDNINQEGISRLVAERDSAALARDIAQRERDHAQSERERAVGERNAALVEQGRCLAERDQAYAWREEAFADRDRANSGRNAALSERDAALAERDAALSERDAALAERDAALSERDAALTGKAVATMERDEARRSSDEHLRMKEFMRNSRSWRLTKPLRFVGRLVRGEFQTAFSPLAGNGIERVPALLVRVRNALRYIERGDFEGLFRRIRSYWQSVAARRQYAAIAAIQGSTAMPDAGRVWGIMATQHTLFIAHIIADRLRNHGWSVEVFMEAPANFWHDWYVVVCPQMFKRLPPGEKRIVFQMEQSVSSRWFTEEYLQTLNNSLAVLEYALVNVEFLVSKGIGYPHVYYLPVGASSTYDSSLNSSDKKYDVLFYGDCNSSPRRREMLDTLRREFDVQEVTEVFGSDMRQIIKQARLVINLHYYENALLEMPRIQECLSLGTPIVSESSRDQIDYPELTGAVRFFEQGSIPAMMAAVREALADPALGRDVESAVACGAQRFEFMFDRFLVGMGFLPASHVNCMRLPLADSVDRVGLSLPETIVRRRVFESEGPGGYAVFDGMRRHPGWVGCGLSYMSLARHATRHGTSRLAVMEDDALLPADFEKKMTIVYEFLDAKVARWDVFSGIIAALHSDTKVLSVEEFKGITFVTIDKMTSMVFNVYGEKILHLLGSWDPENFDVASNAIDRFLERQTDLHVVVTLPYLVGHREEVHSTLWGFQNTQYSDMIVKSEQSLRDMMLAQGFDVPGAGARRFQ